MVRRWVAARNRRMRRGRGRVRRGGEMFLEGVVAIGNLDVCQEKRVGDLHVFKSCMHNSH